MAPIEPGERLVSFVVPALNAAATLGACLDSILAARSPTHSKEVLLIDNGSTDLTINIAQARAAKIVSAPGVTVAALRNLGARLARGDILAYVDADCVIAADWLEKALPHFVDPGVGGVGSPTQPPREATWVQTAWALHRHRHNRLAAVDWLPTENLLVRTAALHEIGGFNEGLVTCEDVDFCFRLGARYKILNDPAVHSIHLGEASTLAGFFKKEVWRGTGNITGFLSHRLHLSELPSVLMPFYYLLGAFALASTLIYCLIAHTYAPALVMVLVLLLPSLLLVLGTVTHACDYRVWAQLLLLYTTFGFARAVSVLHGLCPPRRPSRAV